MHLDLINVFDKHVRCFIKRRVKINSSFSNENNSAHSLFLGSIFHLFHIQQYDAFNDNAGYADDNT